jgi:hypothetical protein
VGDDAAWKYYRPNDSSGLPDQLFHGCRVGERQASIVVHRGALIGTVELYDCVPISWPTKGLIGAGPAVVTHYVNNEELHLWGDGAERYAWGSDGHRDVTDQLPYGDFTPGRWAWLLRDPQPCDPVPMKGALGWQEVEVAS